VANQGSILRQPSQAHIKCTRQSSTAKVRTRCDKASSACGWFVREAAPITERRIPYKSDGCLDWPDGTAGYMLRQARDGTFETTVLRVAVARQSNARPNATQAYPCALSQFGWIRAETSRRYGLTVTNFATEGTPELLMRNSM
jgi:hypothetical protein